MTKYDKNTLLAVFKKIKDNLENATELELELKLEGIDGYLSHKTIMINDGLSLDKAILTLNHEVTHFVRREYELKLLEKLHKNNKGIDKVSIKELNKTYNAMIHSDTFNTQSNQILKELEDSLKTSGIKIDTRTKISFTIEDQQNRLAYFDKVKTDIDKIVTSEIKPFTVVPQIIKEYKKRRFIPYKVAKEAVDEIETFSITSNNIASLTEGFRMINIRQGVDIKVYTKQKALLDRSFTRIQTVADRYPDDDRNRRVTLKKLQNSTTESVKEVEVQTALKSNQLKGLATLGKTDSKEKDPTHAQIEGNYLPINTVLQLTRRFGCKHEIIYKTAS